MEKLNYYPKSDNDWAWVTHTLALLFSVICLGLVTYGIVAIQELDIAKATMGFSSGLLGVILGFYFNRERLTKESREREYRTSQYADLLAKHEKLAAYQVVLLDVLAKEVEEGVEEAYIMKKEEKKRLLTYLKEAQRKPEEIRRETGEIKNRPRPK